MSISDSEVNIVDRLLTSFGDLERAIEGARHSLLKNETVPWQVFERLDSYNGIIERQRSMALEIGDLVKHGDVSEVLRRVTIINALSGMIIDDARDILASFQNEVIDCREEDPINFC